LILACVQVSVFWVATPCSDVVSLKMEAVWSETSLHGVRTQKTTTWIFVTVKARSLIFLHFIFKGCIKWTCNGGAFCPPTGFICNYFIALDEIRYWRPTLSINGRIYLWFIWAHYNSRLYRKLNSSSSVFSKKGGTSFKNLLLNVKCWPGLHWCLQLIYLKRFQYGKYLTKYKRRNSWECIVTSVVWFVLQRWLSVDSYP
jgi:hypothetical protein